MNLIFKKDIKKLIGALGFEIRRKRLVSAPEEQLMKILSKKSIDYVIDVGANAGQFGCALRENGYIGKILSFEPLSAAFVDLAKLAKKDSLWQVEKFGLGAQTCKMEINISANSQSSSFLEMMKAHGDAAPESSYIGRELVDMKTLDQYLESVQVDATQHTFLKIDTQGFEGEVLRGAERALKSIAVIQLEASLTPLYSGQLLYDDLIEFLRTFGFEIWSVNPVFVDPASGRTLQVDVTMCRK